MKERFLRCFKTTDGKFSAALLSFLLITSAGALAATGTFIDSTMVWDGVTRYYEVYLPPVLPANPPMLFMLHGTSFEVPPNTPITKNYGWVPVANKYHFILVKPASTYNPKTGQWNWNAYYMDAAFPSPPDDVGFLRQLILNLTSQYSVDATRVYVAGMSSGGQMTHRVGVEISDLVAAIVPGSGTIVGQLDPPPIVLPNPPVAPISVQEWHGTLDTEIPPCNNGTTNYSGKIFYLATVDQSFNYWVKQDACTHKKNTKKLCLNGSANPNTTGNDATGCSSKTEVQFIWEENVAHSWEPSNNTARWLFLAAHPKQ
jgi:poly(3-hydroxybutyrate) depolymerase